MPYAIAARLNPSASTSTVHIFTSLLQLSPDHPVGSKLLSVLSPGCRVKCKATIARTPTPTSTTLKVVASAVRKPLKSSLKRYSSQAPAAPTVPGVSDRNSATRSRKSVRFKEIDNQLESVCFFRPTGRPSAIFSPISDSDTESDTASSDDDDAPAPSLARPPGRHGASVAAAAMVPLEVADIVSPIPSPHTSLTCHTHVRLEFLSPLTAGLGQGQGPGQPLLLLHGIVRVRNIAYEKCVAVRYTHDNWATAIEVLARYTGPSPLAPTGTTASGDGTRDRDGPWDWFTFTISLGLRAPRASLPRTLLLAVRFTVAGAGEWWDNNGGEDFRIVLAPSPAGRFGRGGTAGGGHGKGPGLESEFARQPLAVPCSTDDVHARAETAWPAAPAPTAVMNRWIYVACA